MDDAPLRTNKPPSNRDDALAVLKRLREQGHVAYFAGGCVRDMLLGLVPADFDVATDAPPTRVRKIFTNTQAVGAKFGVILVKHRASTVEVATFRSEGAYTDGRRPDEVRFTTAEEDAKRRDFTINGMFFDPIENRVVDFVGGQEDLKNRVLRAIGNPDERFEEDHLRLLRAVRFAARFGFDIEPQTAVAIVRHAPLLKRISPERIADELRLMLMPKTRLLAWPMLWRFQLAPEILRFIPGPRPTTFNDAACILQRCGEPMIGFGEALAAIALCYQLQGISEATDVRALLNKSNVAKLARAVRQALRISNDESDQMQSILLDAGLLLADPAPGVAAMKRFLARPTAPAARRLLDVLFELGHHRNRQWIRSELATVEQQPCAPDPFITGEDLIAIGLSPGPMFKNVLNQVYDAQLEDRVRTKEQAMDLARQISDFPLTR